MLQAQHLRGIKDAAAGPVARLGWGKTYLSKDGGTLYVQFRRPSVPLVVSGSFHLLAAVHGATVPQWPAG